MRRLVAGLVLLAVAGCTSHSGSPSASSSEGATHAAQHAQLVAAANLRPCPSSTAQPPASGGLPDVTLACLGDGPAVRMSGLAGTPTVVNLWGSWCTPCQAEAKYLSSAYDTDRHQVGFLGVDLVDDSDSALDFAAHVNPPIRYPSVVDPDRTFTLALRIASASPPVTLFVSAAGRLVHTKYGAYTSTTQLQHDVATYLHVRT